MIDNIRLFQPIYNIKNKRLLLNKLDFQQYKNKDGNPYFRTNIRNLIVTIPYHGNFFFLNGSITKFKYNHNLATLSLSDIVLLIDELSDILNINLENAKIYSIEVGTNFDMDRPIQKYLEILGYISRFERNDRYKTSLYFQNKSKKMIFYDKMNEVNSKNVDYPRKFISKNILRYELILKRNMRQQLLQEVKLLDFKKIEFLYTLIDLWKVYYNKIKKLAPLQKAQKLLFKIDSLNDINTLSYKERIKVIKLLTIDGNSDDLIKELDKKINSYTISR